MRSSLHDPFVTHARRILQKWNRRSALKSNGGYDKIRSYGNVTNLLNFTKAIAHEIKRFRAKIVRHFFHPFVIRQCFVRDRITVLMVKWRKVDS